jgi:hypothetical protein
MSLLGQILIVWSQQMKWIGSILGEEVGSQQVGIHPGLLMIPDASNDGSAG